jgi:transcriptional regulator with GAF, ATPase, and Fis domain
MGHNNLGGFVMVNSNFFTAQKRPISLNERETASFICASQAILGSESFHETARIIFDQVSDIIGATAGYVALLSEDGHENEVLFLEAGGRPCSVDPSLPMPIRGLRAESYSRNITVYNNNFEESEFVHMMPTGHVAMNNVMFAPLVVGQRTVGIIGLANKPTDFTPRDSDVATLFGDLAAIALHNSRNIAKLTSTLTQLEKALAEVKHLRGIIPICSYCKKIRDDQGYWNQVEQYVSEHSEAKFSHGICPACLEREMKIAEGET